MQRYENGVLIDLTPAEIAALTPTLEQAKARRLAALAELRWQHETGGTSVDGVRIATDRESLAFLTAAYVSAREDSDYTVRWKAAPGAFMTLTAGDVIAVATLARAHVQACFDREDALTTAISAAADVAAVDAIDITAGWPEA